MKETALERYPQLLDFAKQNLREIQSTRFKGWDHAESLIWKLDLASASSVYLKAHKQKRKFEQEYSVYKNWLEPLRPHVPSLLAVKPDAPFALLMTELKGDLLEGQSLPSKEEQTIYRNAGAFLRKFHNLPYQDNDIPIGEALVRRTQSWAKRAKSHLSPHDLDWVEARVLEVELELNAFKRVPCHRDYSPRNWIVDDDLELKVIDFEHSRADFWLLDIQRLHGFYWVDKPQLEAAFWEGYGRSMTTLERSLFARCAASAAMSTIVWAKEHKDKKFEAEGWRVFKALRENA